MSGRFYHGFGVRFFHTLRLSGRLLRGTFRTKVLSPCKGDFHSVETVISTYIRRNHGQVLTGCMRMVGRADYRAGRTRLLNRCLTSTNIRSGVGDKGGASPFFVNTRPFLSSVTHVMSHCPRGQGTISCLLYKLLVSGSISGFCGMFDLLCGPFDIGLPHCCRRTLLMLTARRPSVLHHCPIKRRMIGSFGSFRTLLGKKAVGRGVLRVGCQSSF